MSSIKASLRSRSFWESENGRETVLSEPVAIIGMACRLPGSIESTDALWDALAAGVDGISEVPSSRWDADSYYDADSAAPAKINTRFGGFLDAVDRFDPHLFGIAPREAKYIDPQHRILLEVAWDAFLDAGYPLQGLRGTRTGVFFGLCNSDYGRLQLSNPGLISAHTLSGTAPSISTGRLSYLYDLRGPSMVIDTACSSSLVAIHNAVLSLRCRDSNLAIAGGISLNLTPEETISLAKWGMLAPDGRCKTFDEAANGFVRSEGCGLIVLKRLSDALRNKDRILAVIRGSAINQDGRSNVLTAPNGEAQRRVIASAMQQAGVAAADIGLVETHGTGTKVGDPIEVEALRYTVGGNESGGMPCYMGAIKANFGHMEAAAGVAGVIKAVLCLRNRQIPPQPHFRKLNPLISLDGSRLQVPTKLTDWTSSDDLRVAGVSSFGFSGTNAHLILEQAPALPAPRGGLPQSSLPYVFPVSSHFVDGLQESATAAANYVIAAGAKESLADICYTAACRRHHFPHRLAVAATTREELSDKLLGATRTIPETSGTAPRVGFVFSGQGCQWAGMGKVLLGQSSVFADSIKASDAEFSAISDWSIRELLLDQDNEARLEQTRYFQPALFAIQVGLVALWRHAGIDPSWVCGHSVGEIAAAHVAGMLTLADALRVVELRGRLMQESAGVGAMAAVGLSIDELDAVLGNYSNLSIAAENGPTNCTITGDSEELDHVLQTLEKSGVFCRKLKVSSAYHSSFMDEHADSLAGALQGLSPEVGTVTFVSTVSGKRVGNSTTLDSQYWRENLRKPVRFRQAIESMIDDGCNVFVEIGPQPVLAAYIAEASDAKSGNAVALASMRKADPDGLCWPDSLARLYTLGCNVNWNAIYPDGTPASLPPFRFQKERHWFDVPPPTSTQGNAVQSNHPLLGVRRALGISATLFENSVGPSQPEYIGDHRIAGICIFPAAAMIEMMIAAGEILHTDQADWAELSRFSIKSPIALVEGQFAFIQLIVQHRSDSLEMSLYSRPEDVDDYVEIATATWQLANAESIARVAELPGQIGACGREVDAQDFYRSGAANGIEFGSTFRSLHAMRQGTDAAAAKVHALTMDEGQYVFHPVKLDACLQTTDLALRNGAEFSSLMLPTAIESLVYRRGSRSICATSCHIDNREKLGESGILVDSTVLAQDEGGDRVVAICGARFMEATAEALQLQLAAADVVGAVEQYIIEWTSAQVLDQKTDTDCRNLIVCTNSDTILESMSRSFKEICADGKVMGLCTHDVADTDSLSVDPGSRDTFENAIAEVERRLRDGALSATTDVVFDWRDEAQIEADDGKSCGDGLMALLYLLQSMLSKPEIEIGRFLVVTGSANAVSPGMDTNPSQAAIWGLGVSAQVEHPELRCAILDLGAGIDSHSDTIAISGVLRQRDTSIDRLAYRDGRFYLPRLVRGERFATNGTTLESDDFKVLAPDDGVLDSIRFSALKEIAPGAGEVAIRTAGLGVNFRDLLNCLGEVDGPAGNQLGAEVSGTVVAIGDGVDGLAVGDRVMAFCLGGMASSVNVPARQVIRVPCNVDLIEAAGLPVVFTTAIYGLRHLAGINANSRVLIHSAAGGVGLAAIQIAASAGAKIFATAGSPQKRRALRRMGVAHVFDSRSSTFREDVLRATDGLGVDIVLNSLSGDLINASLDCMAPQGTFLELGKRDKWTQSMVDDYRDGIRHQRFDMGMVADEDPELFRCLLQEIVDDVESGRITPINTTAYPARKLTSAFRSMSQGLHIGKMVLSTGTPVAETPADDDARRAVLITGGLGALGLDVAEALFAAGWRQIVLMGRGKPRTAATDRIQEMRQKGAVITVVSGDVSIMSELRSAVAAIGDSGLTLKAVVHCAGELNDAALTRHTRDTFEATMAAKIYGSMNMHRLFSGRRLEFMVYFSSVASVLGWPGQANYAAANAFMDALAHYRQARGLSALSINWGAWKSGGMINATKASSGDVFSGFGIRPMDNRSAVAEMLARLRTNASQVVLASIDWRQFRKRFRNISVPEFYSDVLRSSNAVRVVEQAATEPAPDIRVAVAGKQGPALLRSVSHHLDEMARSVLGIGGTHVLDHQASLNEQGLDSLLAVEMRNRLSKAIAVPLPASIMFDYPSVNQLAAHVVALLKDAAPASSTKDRRSQLPADRHDQTADELRESIDALSDDDAEKELLKELESMTGPGEVEEK